MEVEGGNSETLTQGEIDLLVSKELARRRRTRELEDLGALLVLVQVYDTRGNVTGVEMAMQREDFALDMDAQIERFWKPGIAWVAHGVADPRFAPPEPAK